MHLHIYVDKRYSIDDEVYAFAECRISGDSFGLIHRKLFLEMKQMGLKNGAPKLGNEEMPEDWELRRVPAGPDPLHHNGQDPKKPRTP
ncbi:UNVERIFIED_CONTAM: hypothetical protein Sindi_0569300 [Sesamum indicum]